MNRILLACRLVLLLAFFFASADCYAQASSQKAPELVFMNPTLVAGKDKLEGATYRFANVTPGVDAEIKFKKFSSKSIIVRSVDNSSVGWSKAFQPEFGLAGVVNPNQNWFIDFELSFFETKTTKKLRMSAVDLTALDVDGDGVSISEYVIMNNPTSVAYSSVSYLLGNLGTVGGVGQYFTCPDDDIRSPLMLCTQCLGTGLLLGWQCDLCEGSGLLYSACRDAYHKGTTVQGPVENFTNIDTLATQVMATYSYKNIDKITFRYGAKSGRYAVDGSGVRLNSLWFRQFSLAPVSSLPVKLGSYSVTLDQHNVQLKWTGYEENFSHYIIQRSLDGTHFDDLALIFTGSGSGMKSYSYSDRNVASPTGNLFYRLKMVDITREVDFSAIRLVNLGSGASQNLAAYPNPVSANLRLTLPAGWQGKKVKFEIFSNAGILMAQRDISSASQTEQMETGALPVGSYLVKASMNGKALQQVIIKN